MLKTCNPNKNLVRSACSSPLNLCSRRPIAHLQPLPMGNRRGEIVIISRVEASSLGDHHCCGAKTSLGGHPRFDWQSLAIPFEQVTACTGEEAGGRSSISMEITALTLAALSCSHSRIHYSSCIAPSSSAAWPTSPKAPKCSFKWLPKHLSKWIQCAMS